MLVLLVFSVVIVVVTGGIARRVGDALGLGSAAVTAWGIAKWPVLVIIVSIMLAILYWASPNARHGFRWVSPGGLLAVLLWLVASGLFALYVAFFGNYNKVYGTLGGIIIFLIWMWLSNTAILLGAEFNAELERGRAIAGGVPPGPGAVRRTARRPQAGQAGQLTGQDPGQPEPGQHAGLEPGDSLICWPATVATSRPTARCSPACGSCAYRPNAGCPLARAGTSR